MTAALYGLRANKTVLILEKAAFGGQMTYSPKIENYPGYDSISGIDLADRMVTQVLSQGADAEPAEVLSVTTDGRGVKHVKTDSGEYEAKAVILAVGVKHRRLGLPREEEFTGEGVSYCAVCDGAFYAGQAVAVAGGGNSALQEAVLLSEHCSRVTVVQNLPCFTGEDKLVEVLKQKPNVFFIMDTVITGLEGTDTLTGLHLKSSDGTESTLSVDGLFVAIGLEPENEAFSNIVPLNEAGYIDVTEQCVTGTPGVFAAGDCRKKTVRQITTAAADGASAALAACRYIDYEFGA